MVKPLKLDKKELESIEKSITNPYDLVGSLREHSSWTLGVLLTAVEAALGDTKQAEALKAIVRREMHTMIDRNQAEVYEREGLQERGLITKEVRIVGQDGQE